MSLSAQALFDFEEIEHLWIPMPDGVRLAARLWRPVTAQAQPAPAIFEYIPYRKGDMVRARDERNHPFFAAHGYACLRVDMRGSGDSEGLMADMYMPDELADAHHIINWVAAQPWCDGSVGMFGTSWGGTASLQANTQAPAALKAIIANCATNDRYEDDIHHMGGCLLTDSIEWGATLPAILGSPPNAATVGENWFELWQQRLEHLSFPLEHWIREEARGEYWRHGSARYHAKQWSSPILAIGGWSDRYSSSVMSVVQQRPDLAWGIVGPWGHHYPDKGHPGPAMGFQEIALAWWDHWLKPEKDTKLNWPKLHLWLREFDEPLDTLDIRHGQWIALQDVKHSIDIKMWQLTSEQQLVENSHSSPFPLREAIPIPHNLSIGQASGDTGYFGRYGGLALDQNADDQQALCFDSSTLEEELSFCGQATLTLELDYQSPISQLCARLNDVSPTGQVCRVSNTILNLALDEQLDQAEPPHPVGKRTITLKFPNTAYCFKQGHQIRIALSDSYWPLLWPAPAASENKLISSLLQLPVLTDSAERPKQALPPAQDHPKEKSCQTLSAPDLKRFNGTDNNGKHYSGWHQPYNAVQYHSIQNTFGSETRAEHYIDPDNPLSAHSFVESRLCYERPDGLAEVQCSVTVTCDEDYYRLQGIFTARWKGELIKQLMWTPVIPRRLS